MKRFGCLVALMLLSSSAHAGSSFSVIVGGHRVRIEAPRTCGSPSCVSISIPGVYEARRRRERNDFIDATPALASEPAKPATPAPQLAAVPAAPPQTQPPVEPPVAAPPAIVAPPAPAPKEVVAPTPPPVPAQPVAPPTPPKVTPTNDVVAPAVPSAPPVVKVLHQPDEAPSDSPLGDWRTEGNTGLVRIEPCGKALCGYVLDLKSNAVGESVLINMKPKTVDVWSGSIYSRASGATYYGTMTMKGANSLRVEACVLGRFFCSGNVWSRIVAKPQELITSSRAAPEPRS